MAGAQDSNLEDENQDDLDGKTEANDKSSTSPEKKQKTPEQIERERMRRRRRRQRQRIMRSLETKPEADKNVSQKPAGNEAGADQKKQLEEKKRNDEKLQAEKIKKDTEDLKVGNAEKGEENSLDLKKVDEQKPRNEVPPRGQQLRDESHPRVLDANVAPDMRFDKPVQGDQDQGLQEADKAKDDQQKAEQDRLKKIKEEEKRAADLKRKEKIEKEKAEKIRKENEEQELKVKEDELKKTEEEQKNKQAEEERVEKEKTDAKASLEKKTLEEKNKEIEKEKARLEEEEKIDVAAEKAEAAEMEEPVPVYHPEPEYTTNSFAFEEPKVENPLSDEVQVESETESEVQPEGKNASASDLELMAELMDKDAEPEIGLKAEPGEVLIDVSESVVEEPAEEETETQEAAPDVEEKVEVEEDMTAVDTELPEKEDTLDEDEDTLVSADSVVDEVPIFPPKEVEVVPSDSDDELTFGDVNDEAPSIPVGKMREDHAGSSPDLTLPYDGGPAVDREVTPTEGPNLLSENVEPESKEATVDTENVEKKKEPTNVAEELNEKKAPAVDFAMKLAKASSDTLKKIVPAVSGFFGNVGKFLKGIFGKLNIRMVGGVVALLVVIGLGYFGFTQKWHEQAWGAVSGTFGSFFKPKVEEPKVEVKPEVKDQRAFGITTALLFAQNKGAVSDRLTPDISVALYYGGLQEPRVQGETGISAATFYGELKDQADFVNVYVEYVDTLEHMQSLYKTDVYKLLDQTTKRDVALLKHIDELKVMKEKGLRIQEQIGINLDDLKISYESLNGEKNKGETDFFAALSDLQGQKSDTLLKQFIEVSQKQVALKARVAALSKLQAYYVTALARLDKRLEAIDKNRDPLIQGIRVVDVPGSDLDLIIREQ
jgi:hypothetical protein